jgi:glycerol uptake facilitator-like aquaporin
MKQRTLVGLTQQQQQQQQQQQHQLAKTMTQSQPTVASAPPMLHSTNCLSDDDDDDDDYERFALIARVRFKLFMAELLGTFIFVYLGQSALTSFELNGTQNDMLTRQLATILFYGLAYAFACLLALNLSGAHLNPAYTFASAIFGYLSWSRALGYLCAQYLGAFLAAIFLHVTYSDKLAQRHNEGLLFGLNASLRAHGNILSTGKLFASHPPTEVSLVQLTISYTLATAHLMLLILAVNESRLVRIAKSLRPLYLAGALCLILAAFSANGGPVWNPAQDFSPRLYIALFGWGPSAFNLYNYKYWWLCGLVAPHLGALIGFALYRLFDHLKDIKELSSTSGRFQLGTNHNTHQHEHHNHFHHNQNNLI